MDNNIQNTTLGEKDKIELALLWHIFDYLDQATETGTQLIDALNACRLCIIGCNVDAISGTIIWLIEAIKAINEGKNKGKKNLTAAATLAATETPRRPTAHHVPPAYLGIGENTTSSLAIPEKTTTPLPSIHKKTTMPLPGIHKKTTTPLPSILKKTSTTTGGVTNSSSARAPRSMTADPQHMRVRILDPAEEQKQHSLILVFTKRKEEAMPTETSPPIKTATPMGSMGQPIAKPALGTKSPTLKRRMSAEVTKKTVSRGAKYIKARYEVIKARCGVGKAPGARTSRELPQGLRRRSERIMELGQGPEQGQSVVGSASQQVEGDLLWLPRPRRKRLRREATAKATSPISKLGTGAGNLKRGGRGGHGGSSSGGRAKHKCR
ncbi:hypothetical protein B9Z19DRAFT_1128676 [Tuber borchii]|uniref:Uncharacterized protein n=1 Tax=Tuber borchii TaxID=42251 RepID=A0A2T6ZNV9_TUBBO|nr:hypothetical protein B9Z19DRAFT_1128676 [Tuber borchii]